MHPNLFNALNFTIMKKFSLIVTSIMLLVAVQSFAQEGKLRKDGTAAQVVQVVNSPILRSVETPGDPVIYTNEAAFLGDVGADYYLNNFDDMLYSHTWSYTLFSRSSGSYSFNCTTAVDFYELTGAISTLGQPIVITNTGTPVRAFGGYFYNVGDYDTYVTGQITVTVGTYTYTYLPSSTTSFIGFIFPSTFTSASVASFSSSQYPVISKLYWSALTTGVENAIGDGAVLYPNPTTDGITVNVEGTISVYSTAGQLVVSQDVTKGAYVSLSGLPKGEYVVNIKSANGNLQEKLIKK